MVDYADHKDIARIKKMARDVRETTLVDLKEYLPEMKATRGLLIMLLNAIDKHEGK